MNEIEPRNEFTPTNVLAKQGVAAVAQIAGGVLIFIMHVFSARIPPLGIIFAFIIGGIGISGLISKDPEGKRPGTILTAAGILKLVFHVGIIPVVKSLAGTLLTVSSLGLLALGIWNGIRFLRGLKDRQ
jgi:hypothetical protein